MAVRYTVPSALLLTLLLFPTSLLAARAGTPPAGKAAGSATLTLARRPLSFEVNRGQTDARVRFLSRGSGYTLFLTGTEAVLRLEDAGPDALLRMKVLGAAPRPEWSGEGELPGRSHYLRGRDRAAWRTGIPSYARARFRSVYRGVDLVYHGTQGELEYDFELEPGADPSRIRMQMEGADTARIDTAGDLVLSLDGRELRHRRPAAYQYSGCCRQEVRCDYVLNRGLNAPTPQHPNTPTLVSFRLGAYDRTRPLVIDPLLAYSTYFGGSGNDTGLDIEVDSLGGIYVAGSTVSSDFPMQNPLQSTPGGGSVRGDAFIAKLTPSGDGLEYATYLGGSGSDAALSLDLDVAGNAYVTGRTDSTDFPIVSPIQSVNRGGDSDAFVLKLNRTGSMIFYSTYLGGRGTDFGAGIAVDPEGSAYVTGFTTSDNFPVANALQPLPGGPTVSGEAFVTRINPAGSSLVYSTYLGGSDVDAGQSIDVDEDGGVFVTGFTASNSFPLTPGVVDSSRGSAPGTVEAFVTRINPFGTGLVYSTFLGGSGNDFGYGIAVDEDGNACVTGETASSDFPVAGPLQATFGGGARDAFVAKVTPDGASFVYSTYLGGAGSDLGRAIAADSSGNAYVTGGTFSTNFPLANPLRPHAGSFDAFITKINSPGTQLRFSTCLGGSSQDMGQGIAIGAVGNTYVTGSTLSADFPLFGPLQPEPRGNGDAFIATISEGVAPPAVPTGLHVVSACTSQATLAWTDNSDNEDSFEIERKSGPPLTPGIYLPAGAVEANVTTFNDGGLVPGSIYTYRVRATNSDGPSAYSNEAQVTTLTSLPVAPTELTANAASPSAVQLAWKDNSTDETGFRIERSTDQINFAQVGTVAANVLTFTDITVESSTDYTYRVRATIGGCDSPASNTAPVRTPIKPLVAPTGLTARAVSESEITLTWTDNSNNEDGFKIERKAGADEFAEVGSAAADVTTFSSQPLGPSTRYTFRVRAFNAETTSPYSSEAQATTLAQPAGVLQVAKTLNFGKVPLGTTVTKMLKVRNASRSETMRVTVNNPTAPYTLVSGGGTAYLIVGGIRDVKVSLTPNRTGKITGTMRITSSAPKKGTVTVKLSANVK